MPGVGVPVPVAGLGPNKLPPGAAVAVPPPPKRDGAAGVANNTTYKAHLSKSVVGDALVGPAVPSAGLSVVLKRDPAVGALQHKCELFVLKYICGTSLTRCSCRYQVQGTH